MNESAFPWQIDNGETMRGHKGMTLRDYFAAKAMQTLIDGRGAANLEQVGYVAVSIMAYKMADQMMKQREA